MKKFILKNKAACLLLVVAFGVSLGLLYFFRTPKFYSKEDAFANSKLFDECIPKAVVLMGYMNGVQLNAQKGAGGTYIMYCGVSAVKDHWIEAGERASYLDVYPTMREYFLDIKKTFLREVRTKLNPNQMVVLMVVSARIGVGNFAKRLKGIQPENQNVQAEKAVPSKTLLKEFFYRQSKKNLEVQQYFWTLGQVFKGTVYIKDLYGYPMLSYRNIPISFLYNKSGSLRKDGDLLKKYRFYGNSSVERMSIIPYVECSKLN